MENHKTILVIDDEEDIRELIKALLEPEGFRIVMASNGQEGLDILKRMIPDLIVLDMNMPKMSGIDFYAKIADPKDGHPTVPVLILTGRGNMKSMFEGLHVNGFLQKPFHAIELIDTVKKIVDQTKKP